MYHIRGMSKGISVKLARRSVMAINLYGTVYFRDSVAGTLQQVPDGRYAFTYERTYIESGQPQIAYTLPRALAPQYTPGLPAFFDNLVAEGCLARARRANAADCEPA